MIRCLYLCDNGEFLFEKAFDIFNTLEFHAKDNNIDTSDWEIANLGIDEVGKNGRSIIKCSDFTINVCHSHYLTWVNEYTKYDVFFSPVFGEAGVLHLNNSLDNVKTTVTNNVEEFIRLILDHCLYNKDRAMSKEKYTSNKIDIAMFDEYKIDERVQKCMSDLLKEGAKEIMNLLYGRRLPEIKKVIFNDPATIILWGNGDKTVVKCRLGDEFDPEKGLAMAISKYVLGNNYEYYNTFKHYLKPYSKKESHDAVDVIASNLDRIRKGLEEFSYLGNK